MLVKTAAAAILIVGFVCLPQLSYADLLGVLAGDTIKQATEDFKRGLDDTLGNFLTDAEKKSTALLNKGTNAGSLLTIQAANEMAILASTVRSQFGGELNTKLRSVSVQHLWPVLINLKRWELNINKLQDNMFNLEDLVALDMEDKLPFSAVNLAVRRIKGGVFIEDQPSTFSIGLVGPSFGADPSGVLTTFELTLAGKRLGSPDRKPPYYAIFTVDREDLKNKFQPDRLVTLPLNIKVTRVESAFLGLRQRKQEVILTYSVSLLPKYAGKVIVRSQYPVYEWALSPTIQYKNFTINDDQAAVGTRITLSVQNPATTGAPQPGEMKIDPKTLTVRCLPDMQPARKLKNDNAYPLTCHSHIYPSRNIFESGFTSTNWVAGGGDQLGSYGPINEEFFNKFGFRISRFPRRPFYFSVKRPQPEPPPYLENRCGESERCTLTPAELTASSEAATMDASACSRMEWKSKEQDWEPGESKVTLWLRSKPNTIKDYVCSNWSPNATWQASYQVAIFKPKSELITGAPKEYKVYAGEPLSVEIMKQMSNTSSQLIFEPTMGDKIMKVVPDNVNDHFQYKWPIDMDDRTIHVYEFQYEKINLGLPR